MIFGGPWWLYFFLRIVEWVLVILVTVYWLRAMHRAIAACHPVSRSSEPGMVWLTFIPLFGLVWQFIANKNTAESLAREYHRRGWHSDEERPGMELGAIAGAVVCAVVLLRIIFSNDIHPGFFFAGSIAVGICMYRHIDRLNAYRERLEKEPDPATAFGQIPFAFQQYPPNNYPPQPQWNNPPQYPPQPNYQQQYPPQPNYQQQYPPQPNYQQFQPPPGYAPVPTYPPQYPPAPQQPVAPPDPSQWMPPGQNPSAKPDDANPGDTPNEYDRWMPKDKP